MKEILFRGKRVDNGEWIEGVYAHSGEKKYILIDNDIAVGYLAMKEVNPETVGQYTGLTDKNGTKIFEGDIVRYKNNSPCKIEYIDFQFVMMWEKIYRNFEDVYDHEIEVIGNIHDNPELLKGIGQ